MKKFSEADPGINKLFEMVLYTPMYSKALTAGIELDIFSALTEPKKYTQVAKELSLHPENTEYLLDALTSIELLDKKDGLYKNTALSNKHLVKNSDQYIGEYLKTYNITAGYEDINIVKLVQEGPGKTAQNKEESQDHAELFGDYTENAQKQPESRQSKRNIRSGCCAARIQRLSKNVGSGRRSRAHRYGSGSDAPFNERRYF